MLQPDKANSKPSSRSRQGLLHSAMEIKSPVTTSPFVNTTINSSRCVQTVSLSVKHTARSEYGGGRDSTHSLQYVDSERDRSISNKSPFGAESYVLTSQRSSVMREQTHDAEKELIMSASFGERRQGRQTELKRGIINSPGAGLEMEFMVNLVKDLVDSDSQLDRCREKLVFRCNDFNNNFVI